MSEASIPEHLRSSTFTGGNKSMFNKYGLRVRVGFTSAAEVPVVAVVPRCACVRAKLFWLNYGCGGPSDRSNDSSIRRGSRINRNDIFANSLERYARKLFLKQKV